MLKKIILPVFILISCNCLFAQVYPTFGKEISVTINNLTFDAMEPFISDDGNTLFFNSLNNGINTKLYYATKVNDSTFNFVGEVNGANRPPNNDNLDAVASMDSSNNFFWVSNRNYPAVFENLQHGHYNAGSVTNTSKVYGDIYVHTPGWIVMDAGIDYYGEYLYYCNAYFNNCGGMPCSAKLSIAQKVNDSTYNKITNSDVIMQNINNVNYLVYAPCVTKDGLEYYYTRILISNPQTEICVSVRTSVTDPFSLPSVIVNAPSLTPEAATLTTDKSLMYYHKKNGSFYKIFMRYRNNPTNTSDMGDKKEINIFPNPSSDFIYFDFQTKEKFIAELYNVSGIILKTSVNPKQFDISFMSEGIYILKIIQDKITYIKKIIKQ